MTSEINIFESRSGYNKFNMPVRTVRDRSVNEYDNDVTLLNDASIVHVRGKNGTNIALVSKARNYSSTEFDVMVSTLDGNQSCLIDLTKEQRVDFFAVVKNVVAYTQNVSQLPLAVGLNQHPKGHLLPYRNEVGQKNRVQTLKPLHVHVYETDVIDGTHHRISTMSKEDKRDICDPLILVSGDILRNRLSICGEQSEENPKVSLDIKSAPFGLTIEFPDDILEFIDKRSDLLVEIQESYLSIYGEMFNLFASEIDGCVEIHDVETRISNVEQFIFQNPNITSYSKRVLIMFARNIKDIEDVPLYSTFINGPAITYTLFEKDGKSALNIHPRLMSRGNSADAMGLYVDNEFTKEAETQEDLKTKMRYYTGLVSHLKTEFDTNEGKFFIEQSRT